MNSNRESLNPPSFDIKSKMRLGSLKKDFLCSKLKFKDQTCISLKVNQSYVKKEPVQKHAKCQKSHSDETIKNSQPYLELVAKMKKLEKQHHLQKQEIIKSINAKTKIIKQLKQEEAELIEQKNSLLQEESELLEKLDQVRFENQKIKQQLALFIQNGGHYQDEINVDAMTYEELLELGEKIGNVCKGFKEEEIAMIQSEEYPCDKTGESCTICYCEFEAGQNTKIFTCKHRFHHDCIVNWLLKERTCPMCKQEIQLPVSLH